MKKKILCVIYSIYGGGAEKQMLYILKYVDRKKIEPHLAVFHITGKEKEVVLADVPVYNLSTRLRPASLFLVFKLIKLVKQVQPDKILSFMWGGNLISLMAGILSKKPVIISERIYTPTDLNEYTFTFIRKNLISFLYRRAEKIAAVTQEVKKSLVNDFSIDSKKILVINNAIDIDGIKSKANEFVPQIKDYVLACGRLERQKNFPFLIEVMSEIQDYKLVILGKGSQREYLKYKAKELGVDLILPGYVDNPYPYFRNAKVFVLTSLYEGFPNVILEAMVCGVPVVAADYLGGIREIIKDRENGIIVPQGDKRTMVKAIKEILENPVFAGKLTEKAKETVEKFEAREMVKKYENIILDYVE